MNGATDVSSRCTCAFHGRALALAEEWVNKYRELAQAVEEIYEKSLDIRETLGKPEYAFEPAGIRELLIRKAQNITAMCDEALGVERHQ